MGTINKLGVALGVLVAISISGCHFLEKEKLPREKIAYERTLDYQGAKFKVTLTESVWGVSDQVFNVQAWPEMPVTNILMPMPKPGASFQCFQDFTTKEWISIHTYGYPGGNDWWSITEASSHGVWHNRGDAHVPTVEQVAAMAEFCSYALMNVRHPDYITARGRPAHS